MAEEQLDPDDQDHEFFDILYQLWSQTTWAKTAYWMPEEVKLEDGEEVRYNSLFGYAHYWDVVAVDQQQDRKHWLGSFRYEADAEFVAGLHGAVPDLIRRLHDAIDQAARKDVDNDVAQGMLAEALLENQALRSQIVDLEKALGE